MESPNYSSDESPIKNSSYASTVSSDNSSLLSLSAAPRFVSYTDRSTPAKESPASPPLASSTPANAAPPRALKRKPVASPATPEQKGCFFSQSRREDVEWLAILIEFHKNYGNSLDAEMKQVIKSQSVRMLNQTQELRSVENVLTEQFGYWLLALGRLPDAAKREDRHVMGHLQTMYGAIFNVRNGLDQLRAQSTRFEFDPELGENLQEVKGGIWEVLRLFSSNWGYDANDGPEVHNGYEMRIAEYGVYRQALTDLWSRLGSSRRPRWNTLFTDEYGQRAEYVLSLC